jgi:predicted TIM-barrel fold metal-dependent hydrolase
MTKKDYFIIDTETHPSDAAIWHQLAPYQGTQALHALPAGHHPAPGPGVPVHGERRHAGPFEKMISNMDASGTDMACLIPEAFLFCSGGTTPISTNAWMLDGVQKYPDRFIMCPNFGPIIQRGVDGGHPRDGVPDEGVRRQGLQVLQSPEDTYINDKRLWPFYAKAQELGPRDAGAHRDGLRLRRPQQALPSKSQLEDVLL